VSLYRRYRPQSFDEVVGQTHIVRTMRNAVEQEKVHHAYLFVGSRGTGKTSIAKILARSLNCVKGPTLEPCGECESCRSIAASTSLDVIEMDAASNNSVEDIRDLREKVGFVPAVGRWKVYILDEAHMLSGSAWNAFLKTLEEPPPNTIFVLATTEAHKVPATIVDRCHRFDFQRPSLEEITTVLRRIADAEGIGADDKTLALIARSATGSFRDAIGTLDQLVTYGGPEVSYETVLEVLGVADADLIFRTTDAVIAHDPGATLARVEELSASGRDSIQFMRDLIAHLRQLVVVQTIGEAPDSFSVTADQTDRLIQQAQQISQREAVRAIDLTSAALAAVKEGSDARIQLELALLKSASPRLDGTVDALLSRIEQLERGSGPGPDASPTGAEHGPVSVEEAPAAETSKPASPPKAASEGLEAVWPAALEQVRAIEGGAMLAALLSGARPVTLDDSRLVISYPPTGAFSKRKVEDPVNRDRIAGALKLVTGKALVLECELSDEDSSSGSSRFGRHEEFLSEEELIERIKDVFDAEDVLEEA
jgi:DNA polymerase-3 subunit gamma/tau